MPVANPDGVAPLLAIAFAARSSDDPPARVLALVNRIGAEVSPGAPPNPDGFDRGAGVRENTRHRDRAAIGVVCECRRRHHRRGPQREGRLDTNRLSSRGVRAATRWAAWYAMSSLPPRARRSTSAFSSKEPIGRLERVFAAVDSTPDGRAALDLAVRIAKSNSAKLRVLLVSNTLAQPEDHLLDIIRDARSQPRTPFP